MRYLVVERYTHGPRPVYERAARQGRMLPDGLRYLDSWVVADEAMDRCFQLMEADDPALFEEWLEHWRDLGDFDVYPVISSAEAAQRLQIAWPSDG